MQKKKKPEVIHGISNDPENKLVVQKSRPLFALWASPLTLAEFKLLDMYLARINTRDPDHRTVCFTKGELETALGVTRINKPDLKARIKHLSQMIDLAPNDDDHHANLISLFEQAKCALDENGLWTVTLTCTAAAMRYIFKAEELGYLRYKLRSITNLTSRYSYVLFCYLEDNRFRKSWTVDLDELKSILNCTEESYSAFKVFNDRILKRCYAELTAKTECRFTYEPVKAGRRVTAIRFELETIPDILPEIDSNQLSLFAADGSDAPSGDIELWCDALPGFTVDEVEEIAGVLRTVPKSKLPMPESALSLRRYHYLLQVYAKMQRYDAKKPIKHKLAYLLKAIGEDAR